MSVNTTTAKEELLKLVMEYGFQGSSYEVTEDEKYLTVKMRMMQRRLLMQLVAFADRRKLYCFIAAINGQLEFVCHG
jgi:hypothetical protein